MLNLRAFDFEQSGFEDHFGQACLKNNECNNKLTKPNFSHPVAVIPVQDLR